MKRIHTQAKKANRSSAYQKSGSFREPSESRKAKRAPFHKVKRLFGLQKRTQAIEIRKKFRTFIKTIFHEKQND